jgi:hypothetical protein
MSLTHKQQFNKRYKQPLGKSNRMEELAKMTKIPLNILKEVDKRGRGAWKTNIRSVRQKGTFKKNLDLPRSQKLSAEQWGIARVYAFINKLQTKQELNHDVDLARKIPGIKIID